MLMGGGLYNLFLPLSSMAPITGDLGPLGGVVVIACFRSASVGKWTRPLLNPPALLSACFLTTAKYTRPFVPHGPKNTLALTSNMFFPSSSRWLFRPLTFFPLGNGLHFPEWCEVARMEMRRGKGNETTWMWPSESVYYQIDYTVTAQSRCVS